MVLDPGLFDDLLEGYVALERIVSVLYVNFVHFKYTVDLVTE